MNIKVLGPGCHNCKTLHKATEEAVAALHKEGEVQIEYVQNMDEIQKFPIFATPGLVIDGEVVHQGKPLPNAQRIQELIQSRSH